MLLAVLLALLYVCWKKYSSGDLPTVMSERVQMPN